MLVRLGGDFIHKWSAVTGMLTAASVTACLMQTPALADGSGTQEVVSVPPANPAQLQPTPPPLLSFTLFTDEQGLANADQLQPTPPPLLSFTLFPDEQQPPLLPPLSKRGPLAFIGQTADAIHEDLEHGILRQTIRFDNFFGVSDTKKPQRSAFLLRWRSEILLKQGGHFDWGSTLRADFKFPKIDDRLHLALSGADKTDSTTPTLPEDPGNPGFDRTVQTTKVVNTELRYVLFEVPSTDFFLGAGVDIVLPPKAFVRARFQHTQKLGESSLFRFGETIFAKTPYGPGETTEVTVDRTITPTTLLRWANSGTLSREIKALEWGSALALLHQLSAGSAITEACGIYGNSSIEHWITNYQLLARYRHRFMRDWLFYEVEPQVNWTRQLNGNFDANLILTLRLEVVFQGKEP